MGPGLKHLSKGFVMKRDRFAVYVYAADGSTVEFREDFIDDKSLKGLDKRDYPRSAVLCPYQKQK